MRGPYRRRNILPIPSLQLRLVALCLFFSVCSALIQAILSQRFIAELFVISPEIAALHRAQGWLWVLRQFSYSMVILFPLALGIGVLVTFRYAGPIVNMKKHLKRIETGEDPGPCCLRKGDQLHDLADAINGATAALRARAQASFPTGGSAQGANAADAVLESTSS